MVLHDFLKMVTHQSRNVFLVVMIVVATFFSGCSHNSKKLFPDSYKPKIAVIASVPNEIIINYIGPSVFQNRSTVVASSYDVSTFISSELQRILAEENIAEVVDVVSSDLRLKLHERGPGLEGYWYKYLPDNALAIISEWGKGKDIEYILLVLPGSWGESNGNGIHVEQDMPYLHSIYRFELINVKNASIHSSAREVTLKRVPIYRHSLSEKEKIAMLSKWEKDKQRTYNPTDDIYSPDMYLDFSSRYKGDDFLNLSNKKILEINEQLIPVIKEEIRQNLIDMGLIVGRTSSMEHIMN